MRATCRQLAAGVQVISNDQASALLAREIEADIHVTTTAAPAVFVGFGTPDKKANLKANPDLLLAEEEDEFAGWTLPKVMAAFGIARSTGKPAMTRALSDISYGYDARRGRWYPRRHRNRWRRSRSNSGLNRAATARPPSPKQARKP
jgi:carbamate kinase